ncbi:AtpZ/AtpI family protein [Phenylobacterium sp.]|jgi:ATP synthase protein I|uniref:AtpZ/AtpI family protein n=1 Tax=Phenylobacterium sp. TaxID=1871053 RepID=UPI002F954A42
MSQPDDLHREARERLEARLDAVESERARQESGDAHKAMARGYRFLGEVVGGVLGGAGLGWLVDQYAGTAPLGLVGGLLMGSALSIFVAVKTAAKASRIEAEKAGPLPSVPDDEDED